jgi:hypothetical protein
MSAVLCEEKPVVLGPLCRTPDYHHRHEQIRMLEHSKRIWDVWTIWPDYGSISEIWRYVQDDFALALAGLCF